MIKKQKFKIFPILFLLIIALFLRFYKLSEIPKSLHLDEVANAYTGRFILENKKDLYGNPFPIFYFDKFGDYPPVIPMYIQALGTYIFGFNELGSRSIVAILGSLLVIPIYFISLAIFGNWKTAFFSGLMVAVIPWQVVFSRQSAEGIIASVFYFFGLLILIKFIQKKKFLYVLLSLPFFISTYFLYPGFRILTPLTFFPLFLFFNKKKDEKKSKKLAIISFLSFLLLFIISFLIINSYWGKGRGNQVSIFNFVSGVENNNLQLIYREKNPIIARIFNNKVIGYSRKFIGEYFDYFSGKYLFITGGGEITHKVPNSGELYLIFIPLFILGLFDRLRKYNQSINYPLFYYGIYLLLISAIPGAITVIAVPNFHRTITMSVFYILLASYGFNILTKINFKKMPVYILVYPVVLIELIYFMHNFITHVDYIQFIGNNEGAKEAFQEIYRLKNNYKKVFAPGTHYYPLYYLYFQKKISSDLIGKFRQSYYLPQIDNIYFSEKDCFFGDIIEELKKEEKTLLLLKETCLADIEEYQYLNLKLLNKFQTSYGNYSLWLYEFAREENKKFFEYLK